METINKIFGVDADYYNQMKQSQSLMQLLETYKGHDISNDGGAIVVTETGDTVFRYYVALDDSKRSGSRKWDEGANNLECARRYIDWVNKVKAEKTPEAKSGNTKHTPGKWSVDHWAPGITISAPDSGYSVCHLEGCNNAEANAKLISAAPDLLEAAQAMLNAPGQAEDNSPRAKALRQSAYDKLYAAIQKATLILCFALFLSSCSVNHRWQNCVRCSDYTDAALCECDYKYGKDRDPESICNHK